MEINETITNLQSQAGEFLSTSCLSVNGVIIYPKEIEAYYYKAGEFEDYTVHMNELQQNNRNHFYVHRYGTEKNSKYIGGTRGGCDFVMSDNDNVFFSYLIRSIVIDGELVVGPRKSLNAILEKTGLNPEELERVKVDVLPSDNKGDILNSIRIGLGKPSSQSDEDYQNAELRFIICDDYFKQKDKSGVGYPKRTDTIDNLLRKKLETGDMTKEEAIKYSYDKFGSVSGWLKRY